MNELIPISVVIADRTYRLKVEPRDEQVVRKTVKAINDKVLEFKSQFAGKDMQDYVSMVLIWFASEQNTAVTTDADSQNLSEKLNSIERLLDARLL
jgi:cell division protein ZapA (FtsZ GTPase activity inhibitor)